MARSRSFTRGAVAIRKSRETSWISVDPGETTLVSAGGTISASLNAAALALRPFTIVRTHLFVGLASDQTGSSERQGVGIGLAVVSDQAVLVGVSAVPTPITDNSSNLWFVHQMLWARESRVATIATPGQFVSVDSKAMRKVEIGQDIILVAELTTFSDGCVVTCGGRILIKNN